MNRKAELAGSVYIASKLVILFGVIAPAVIEPNSGLNGLALFLCLIASAIASVFLIRLTLGKER